MGNCYSQLSLSERIEVYRFREDGMSLRGIAERLGRSVSTISRELVRNAKATKQYAGGYLPERAHSLALRRRRWDCRFKLSRQPALRALVRDQLVMGWSPEQIAGRLARQHGCTIISHESIYRYIYHRSAQKDYWHRWLPRARFRRGRHSRRTAYRLHHLKQRTPIHERPPAIDTRREAGHWEADLMLFAVYGQAVLVSVERKTRLAMAVMQGKSASETAQNLKDMLRGMPESLRKTLTLDNGTEFAEHHRLAQKLSLQTYFCDVRAPWQKGSVENTIGRLRRVLPRKTNLNTISQKELNSMIYHYNNMPRKCLDFYTPLELFYNELKTLHFNRESTFPPARE